MTVIEAVVSQKPSRRRFSAVPLRLRHNGTEGGGACNTSNQSSTEIPAFSVGWDGVGFPVYVVLVPHVMWAIGGLRR